MRYVVPLFVVGLFLFALFAGIPEAEGAHAWGHRFMVSGRILDAEGNPAQMIEVRVTAETTHPVDPIMVLQTDCQGLYYSQQTQAHPQDRGLDGGRLHIHNFEYASDPHYTVITPYGEHRARADRDQQSTTANIRLDEVLEPEPACEGRQQISIPHPQCQGRGDGSWQNNHVVVGKVQVIDGRARVDQVSHEGTQHVSRVNVSLQTSNGLVTQEVTTDVAAIYCAVFENVTVEPGARITATWDGNTKRGSADTEFHFSTVDIIVREWFFQETGFQVFMGILAGIAVLGLAVWGGTRVKDRAATKKAMERSTRKRANK